MSENGSAASSPEEEVKRVREGAAMAFHEFRKALMPLAGTTEFCAARCRKLFEELEALAAELPEGVAARLRGSSRSRGSSCRSFWSSPRSARVSSWQAWSR